MSVPKHASGSCFYMPSGSCFYMPMMLTIYSYYLDSYVQCPIMIIQYKSYTVR